MQNKLKFLNFFAFANLILTMVIILCLYVCNLLFVELVNVF